MATTTTNFGWDIPQSTDLVKDGATAIAALGQDIDTALVDLKGGTTGQILAKASNTDLDYSWITNDVGDITAVTAGTGISGGGTSGAVTVTNSMATAITTAGDLIYGTGSGTFSRLGTGTAGQVLKVNSGATAPEWGTVAGSGLTLITSASFTSVTAANVNSCFTSTYQNYLIVLTIDNYIIDQPLYMRYRAGGADNSTSNYIRNFGDLISTGYSNNYATGQPEIRLGAVDSSWSNARFGAVMTVQNPQLAKATLLHHSCANTGYASEPTHTFGSAAFTANTQFDGFSIVTLRADTMTGNYKVYGYAN